MAVWPMLSMRQAVFLLASSAAVTAQGPSLAGSSGLRLPATKPTLSALELRVQRPGNTPGELSTLPLHRGHNRTGEVIEFHSNVSEYTVVVPGNFSMDGTIRSVRLYAHHAMGAAEGKKPPELRVISYATPADWSRSPPGFDQQDVRSTLEDPYCADGDNTGPCKKYFPDGQAGGFFHYLNALEGSNTKFELIACPYNDEEKSCEQDGTTYTLWVFFPEWNKGAAPGAPVTWGWVAGCVLCEISAFLYACGICLQRYGLSLKSEEATRSKRQSTMGITGSELEPSVASHIVTAPPGSVAGQMVSVPVNGRQIRVEVPVGVGPGDQFSVPLVDGGAGLGGTSLPGGGGQGCRARFCSQSNLIWMLGMSMWFIGNSLYTYALNFAPLSLLTSLFATVLVFNGLLAWFFLHEKVRASDVAGWALIFVGISICGVYIDKTVVKFTAHEILVFAEKPVALIYEGLVISTIVGITIVVSVWTSRNPGTEGPFPTFMKFSYPCILAMYECLIQICLKGISNMMDLTFTFFSSKGASGAMEVNEPMFWVIFVLCGLCSLAVMIWMRRGYARFEAVQMLPIQSELQSRVSQPLVLALSLVEKGRRGRDSSAHAPCLSPRPSGVILCPRRFLTGTAMHCTYTCSGDAHDVHCHRRPDVLRRVRYVLLLILSRTLRHDSLPV